MYVRPSPKPSSDRSFPVFETPAEARKAYLFGNPITKLILATGLLNGDSFTIPADESGDHTRFPRELVYSSPNKRIIKVGDYLAETAEQTDDYEEAALRQGMSNAISKHFANVVAAEPINSLGEEASTSGTTLSLSDTQPQVQALSTEPIVITPESTL